MINKPKRQSTNKNIMKIIVLDQWGGSIIIFGQFTVEDFQKIINIAKKYDMPCLGFIDTIEDTYFNEEQCADIQKELVTLKNYKELNKNLLHALFRASDTAVKSESYIKIGKP